MKVELLNNEFSPQENLEMHAPRGQFELILIKSDEEAFSLKGRIFPLQNPSNSGSSSQH